VLQHFSDQQYTTPDPALKLKTLLSPATDSIFHLNNSIIRRFHIYLYGAMTSPEIKQPVTSTVLV
jgi:hypothetical protein